MQGRIISAPALIYSHLGVVIHRREPESSLPCKLRSELSVSDVQAYSPKTQFLLC